VIYRLIRTALAGVAVLAVLAGPGVASGAAGSASPSLALFEGRTIDLSQGWEQAQACLVAPGAGIAECYRSREALHAREAQLVGSSLMLAACSSPLRLYADIYYGGRELALYDRGYWQNLSTWSFDNQLSSYKVGACGARLAENANGGGAWYSGGTSAGAWEPFMLSGWDNRVSSIYIQ
jgi:hypothetical protein